MSALCVNSQLFAYTFATTTLYGNNISILCLQLVVLPPSAAVSCFACCPGGACVLWPGAVCGRGRRRGFYDVHHVSREEAALCACCISHRHALTHTPCNLTSHRAVPIVHLYVCVCVCVCVCVGTFVFLSSRSSNYPFSDSPLYTQTPPASSSTYYEPTPSSESDITGSVTSQPVSVATAGANSAGAAAGGGGYVIPGGYVLGGGGGGAAVGGGGGGGQSYSSPNSRAPPATVSTQVQSGKCIGKNLRPESSENVTLWPSIFPRCSGCVIITRGRRGWVYLAAPSTTTTCYTARSRN